MKKNLKSLSSFTSFKGGNGHERTIKGVWVCTSLSLTTVRTVTIEERNKNDRLFPQAVAR